MYLPAKRQHRNSTDKRQKKPVPQFSRDLSYISRNLSFYAHTSAPAPVQPLPSRKSPRVLKFPLKTVRFILSSITRNLLYISHSTPISTITPPHRPSLIMAFREKKVFFVALRGPSWTKKGFLRGPHRPKRCSSRPFVAFRGQKRCSSWPSWIKTVFFAALRGPSWPFVDKKGVIPLPPRLTHFQLHSRPILW